MWENDEKYYEIGPCTLHMVTGFKEDYGFIKLWATGPETISHTYLDDVRSAFVRTIVNMPGHIMLPGKDNEHIQRLREGEGLLLVDCKSETMDRFIHNLESVMSDIENRIAFYPPHPAALILADEIKEMADISLEMYARKRSPIHKYARDAVHRMRAELPDVLGQYDNKLSAIIAEAEKQMIASGTGYFVENSDGGVIRHWGNRKQPRLNEAMFRDEISAGIKDRIIENIADIPSQMINPIVNSCTMIAVETMHPLFAMAGQRAR